jgi:phosphoribosyl-ATP pyrophosphohydrolase/phosphoribosyl-AMP cyclohydrolase
MAETEIEKLVSAVNFQKMNGLVPVVVQDASNNKVLMQAFMNKETLQLTLESGRMHYWSRTRNRVWMKGEQSGNYSIVQKVALDCDSDSLLFSVQQIGPCCHTGNDSCFDQSAMDSAQETVDGRVLERVFEVINERVRNPREQSYVSKLTNQGENSILQKIGEETFELVLAAKDAMSRETISEASDLLFHIMVLFAARKMDIRDCFKELKNRHYAKTKAHSIVKSLPV